MARSSASEQTVLTGTFQGREVTLTDRTGTIPDEELREILDAVIREGRFGLAGLSNSGSGTIRIGAPEGAHIQVGNDLYRLIVTGYEAYVDKF